MVQVLTADDLDHLVPSPLPPWIPPPLAHVLSNPGSTTGAVFIGRLLCLSEPPEAVASLEEIAEQTVNSKNYLEFRFLYFMNLEIHKSCLVK